MPRRLTPEARRAEIIAIARQAIAEDGYQSLSLREVARRCDMSAPGLMHHFPDLPSLLLAVLENRDAEDLAQIATALPADARLDDLIEAAIAYYAQDPSVRAFDQLETEAVQPGHPAHEYFRRRDELVFQSLRPIVERQFEHPDRVFALMCVVTDGMRLRRMRDPEGHDMRTDWLSVRDAVFAASPERTPSE